MYKNKSFSKFRLHQVGVATKTHFIFSNDSFAKGFHLNCASFLINPYKYLTISTKLQTYILKELFFPKNIWVEEFE
jgi:hypothetical protein